MVLNIQDIPTVQRVGKDVAQIFFTGKTDSPLHSLDDYSIAQVRGSGYLQQFQLSGAGVLAEGALCGSSVVDSVEINEVPIITAPFYFRLAMCQTELDATIYKYLPEPGGSVESVTPVISGLLDTTVRSIRADILNKLWATPTTGWATTLDVNDVATTVDITAGEVWQVGEAAEFLRNLYTKQSANLIDVMDEDKVLHVSNKLFSALRADVAAGCCNELSWLASQDATYRPTYLGIRLVRNQHLLPARFDALLTHRQNLVVGLDRTNPNNMLRMAFNEHTNQLEIKGQIYLGKAVLIEQLINTSRAVRT